MTTRAITLGLKEKARDGERRMETNGEGERFWEESRFINEFSSPTKRLSHIKHGKKASRRII